MWRSWMHFGIVHDDDDEDDDDNEGDEDVSHVFLWQDTLEYWELLSLHLPAPAPASPSLHLKANQWGILIFGRKVLPSELLCPPDKEDTEFLMTLGIEVLAWSLRVAILTHPTHPLKASSKWSQILYFFKTRILWCVIILEQWTGVTKAAAPRLSHL